MNVKFDAKNPPRTFEVGYDVKFAMHDCAPIASGARRADYLRHRGRRRVRCGAQGVGASMPRPASTDGCLSSGCRAVLIHNRLTHRYFVLLVERGKGRRSMLSARESCEVVSWLDSARRLTVCGRGSRDGPGRHAAVFLRPAIRARGRRCRRAMRRDALRFRGAPSSASSGERHLRSLVRRARPRSFGALPAGLYRRHLGRCQRSRGALSQDHGAAAGASDNRQRVARVCAYAARRSGRRAASSMSAPAWACSRRR